MFTPKQERNGATGSTAAHNPAIPGPDSTAEISAALSEAVATDRYSASVFGRPPSDGTIVDWETGVGGHDMPGEA